MDNLKKYSAIIAIPAIVILAGYAFYYFAISTDYLADSIMEDLKNGDVAVIGGIIIDKRLNTFLLIEGLMAKRSKGLSHDEKQALLPLYFNLPKGIKSYEHLETTSEDNESWRMHDISEPYYKSTFSGAWDTYEEYLDFNLTAYKGKPGFRHNEELERIEYYEIAPFRRYYYRVETVYGIKKVQICLTNYNKKWVVAAIFTESI